LDQQKFQHTMIQGMAEIGRDVKHLRRDLLGNGQPGRVNKLETAVGKLKGIVNRARGAVWAILAVSGGVIALVVWLFSQEQ